MKLRGKGKDKREKNGLKCTLRVKKNYGLQVGGGMFEMYNTYPCCSLERHFDTLICH